LNHLTHFPSKHPLWPRHTIAIEDGAVQEYGF
jgi:hypothetical protein